jgi:hypothetical protein
MDASVRTDQKIVFFQLLPPEFGRSSHAFSMAFVVVMRRWRLRRRLVPAEALVTAAAVKLINLCLVPAEAPVTAAAVKLINLLLVSAAEALVTAAAVKLTNLVGSVVCETRTWEEATPSRFRLLLSAPPDA